MNKEAYYFSHDSNARHDPNICEMRADFGMEGYGIYWAIIEMLREQEEYKLKLNRTKAITMQTHCEKKKIQMFIKQCIDEYNLFESDGEYFWSISLLRRMKMREIKSEKARKSANTRWKKKSKGNANAKRTQCDSNAIKESKVKESKNTKGVNSLIWEKLSEKFIKATAIERKKTPSPKQWGKKLKTFCQREVTKKARLKKVLLWYISQFDKNSNPYSRKHLPKYVPQTNSIRGFCQKFYDIECAMMRITKDNSDPNSKRKIKKTKEGAKISYEED